MNIAKVIVFTNQKGGCGKTTATVHVASCLVQTFNKKVLVIDADPQHTVSRWTTNKTAFPFATLSIYNEPVHKIVEKNSSSYDYILIDCPPSIDSQATFGSLLVANTALIPVLCSANDLWAMQKILSTIKDAKKMNRDLQEFILVNQYHPRENLTKGIIAAIEDLRVPILISKLGSRLAFRESAALGTTVFALNDKKAISEIVNLTKEVMEI